MDIEKLQQLIDKSHKIVFFGGAGVSTESGIKDFRSKDGLYSEVFLNYRPEEILSRSFFHQHTDLFYQYYKAKFLKDQPKPNQAHLYLSKLEASGKLLAIITQNIDGLHQMAGSKHVLELHGSIHRNYGMKTGKFYTVSDILEQEGTPYGENNEIIKPDVTLYEEPLNQKVINDAIHALEQADLLIVGGTSLTVYPASGMIHYYKGKDMVVINRERVTTSGYFIEGSIAEIMSKLK